MIFSKSMAQRGGKREGAGRPVAKHTLEAAEARKQLIADYIANIKPINAALIKKAIQGDIAAIRELHDRVYGKSVQPIGNADDRPFAITFDPAFDETA